MKKNSTRFRALLLLLCAGVFLFASSCSHKVGFAQSSIVPAASGSVKVKKDKNKNYRLEVSITNLAPPSRLQPAHSTYVVWIETEQNGIKNIGRLNSESGFLSKAFKADLNAVSPFKPTRLFITAEDDAAILNPGSMVVLSTDRFN